MIQLLGNIMVDRRLHLVWADDDDGDEVANPQVDVIASSE